MNKKIKNFAYGKYNLFNKNYENIYLFMCRKIKEQI